MYFRIVRESANVHVFPKMEARRPIFSRLACLTTPNLEGAKRGSDHFMTDIFSRTIFGKSTWHIQIGKDDKDFPIPLLHWMTSFIYKSCFHCMSVYVYQTAMCYIPLERSHQYESNGSNIVEFELCFKEVLIKQHVIAMFLHVQVTLGTCIDMIQSRKSF